MVGCLHNSIIEEEAAEDTKDLNIQSRAESEKPYLPSNSLDFLFDDLSPSFSDSFLDINSFNDWFTDIDQKMADLGGNLLDSGLEKVELDVPIENAKVVADGFANVEEFSVKVESFEGLSQENGENEVVENGSKLSGDAVCERVNVEGNFNGDGTEVKPGDLRCLIEEKLEKVSLDGTINLLKSEDNEESDLSVINGNEEGMVEGGLSDGDDVKFVDENGMKSSKNVSGEDKSDSDEESEGESSSSSSSADSSSSSSDDEDEEETEREDIVPITLKGEIDMEEGEIMLSEGYEMVAWSDDDEDIDGMTGPIKSKNELKILPPVPPVTVTLEPHHHTVPIGIILSVMGAQVIVEGVEKHSPLSEGSILWITQTRSPLGIVDEIFGPVKNPYYIVRHNSESELPSGIEQGTLISFVPEFANHVLNDKSLYQKGYDASNENDEELSDELEFSDDEKEAEYKKMLKMKKKRGKNESNLSNRRKGKQQFKNQTGNGTENTNDFFKSRTPLNQENNLCLSSLGQGSVINNATVPSLPGPPGFCAPNGIWDNGFPPQPQNIGFPNGVPPNGMQWMQQNNPNQFFQAQGMRPQQQMGTMLGFPGNFNFNNSLGGVPNFGVNTPFAPWPGFMNQNVLNQLQFAMGLQAQQAPQPLNEGEQAVESNGSQINHNAEQSPENLRPPLNFNRGRGGGRMGGYRGSGRGGIYRGGGRGGNYRGGGRGGRGMN